MAEKLDPLSDLDVTKLRLGYPIGCASKKQETKRICKMPFFMGYLGAVHRNLWWAHQGSNLGPADRAGSGNLHRTISGVSA
jgi:hypothetical protein